MGVVLWFLFVLLSSDVSGKVTVVSVMDVLHDSVHSWIVESIELVSDLVHVVLDTIAVLVVDSSLLEDHQGSVGLQDDDIISFSVVVSGVGVDPLGACIVLLLSPDDAIVAVSVVDLGGSLRHIVVSIEFYCAGLSQEGQSGQAINEFHVSNNSNYYYKFIIENFTLLSGNF